MQERTWCGALVPGAVAEKRAFRSRTTLNDIYEPLGWVMKRLLSIMIVTLIIGAQTGWCDKKAIPDTRHGNPHDTSATDITLFGIAAASILGAGAYVVRRARSKDRG